MSHSVYSSHNIRELVPEPSVQRYKFHGTLVPVMDMGT